MPEDEDKGEGPEEKDTIGYYHGDRNADGDRHGQGWAILPNGDFYQGCYYKGLRNGRGLYVFMRNGARYEGEYRKALKHGLGTMHYPDGSKYEGDWKNDLKHGYGTYEYPNNDSYKGAWYKGTKHGLGTYFFSEMQVKYMGTWVEGIMQGPGQVFYPGSVFYGAWKKNKPLGPGCFVFDTPEQRCMQHGFYLLVKDPALEELGEGDEEEREREMGDGDKNLEEEEEIDETKGKVSVWRARSVTAYVAEFLPPEPVPLPVCDSEVSLIAYSDLMAFEPPSVSLAEEEEVRSTDSWLQQREQFIEEADEE